MAAPPTNPPLIKNGTEAEPARGQTQLINGNLHCLYRGQWRPAVRQHLIRAELIRQTDLLGSYKHGRKNEGTTNVTAFLHKDRDLGSAWADRPQILFELYPPNVPRNVKPVGVLIHGGLIMLDPYDHPIRDFPGELPVVLSSNLEPLWVEYYLRQNEEIKAYDLMARMPLVKRKGGILPVRVGTITERATKYRRKAGAITWHDKEGSKEIRAYILSLLPAGARDTRSLNGDLTPAQQAQLKAVNLGTKPERRHKVKRQAEAEVLAAVAAEVDEDANGYVLSHASQAPIGQGVPGPSGSLQPYTYHDGQRNSVTNNSPVEPLPTKEAGFTSRTDEKIYNFMKPPNPEFSRRHKRSREQQSTDLKADDLHQPQSKRRRTDECDDVVDTGFLLAQPRSLKRGFSDVTQEDAETGDTAPGSIHKRPRHDSAASDIESDHLSQGPASASYQIIGNAKSAPRTYLTPKLGSNTTRRAESTSKKRESACRPNFEVPPIEGYDGGSVWPYTGRNLSFVKSRTAHHRSFPYPDEKHSETVITSSYHAHLSYGRPTSTMGTNGNPTEAHVPSHSPAATSMRSNHAEESSSTQGTDHGDNSCERGLDGTPRDHGNNPRPPPPAFDPYLQEFQTETHEALRRGDHRYIKPSNAEEIAIVSEAIQLSRYDMILQLGENSPQLLGNEHYPDESYMSQWCRLQCTCIRSWTGPGPAPVLYGCSEDWIGFGTWLVTDDRGLELLQWSAIAGAL